MKIGPPRFLIPGLSRAWERGRPARKRRRPARNPQNRRRRAPGSAGVPPATVIAGMPCPWERGRPARNRNRRYAVPLQAIEVAPSPKEPRLSQTAALCNGCESFRTTSRVTLRVRCGRVVGARSHAGDGGPDAVLVRAALFSLVILIKNRRASLTPMTPWGHNEA
jgi:hypothetical protein